MARSPEYPQRIRVASVFELLDCSLEANFLIFLLLTSSCIVLSPLCLLFLKLLARSPDDPQRSRVVSVFELLSVCLFVLCLIVGKFSNSDCQYRQTNKPTIHSCIVVHCACLLPIVLVMVNCSFSLIQRINKVVLNVARL